MGVWKKFPTLTLTFGFDPQGHVELRSPEWVILAKMAQNCMVYPKHGHFGQSAVRAIGLWFQTELEPHFEKSPFHIIVGLRDLGYSQGAGFWGPCGFHASAIRIVA